MDERAYYSESQTTKPAVLNCPYCRSAETYELRWAVRKKKDCSIVRAVELLREGKADAVVSPGNTGGIFAAATFRLGRIEGVDRSCPAHRYHRRTHLAVEDAAIGL